LLLVMKVTETAAGLVRLAVRALFRSGLRAALLRMPRRRLSEVTVDGGAGSAGRASCAMGCRELLLVMKVTERAAGRVRLAVRALFRSGP
jgi:hypothetical protein